MRDLALHQITMMRDGPARLVSFAVSAGIHKVCLFTETPVTDDGQAMFPIVDASEKKWFQTLLADHGVGIINAEYFPVMPGADVEGYRPAIELAAELGAKRLVTHIHEEVPARIADQLDKLCSMGQALDLEIGLEFTGFAKGCDSLEKAIALQDTINRSNLKIGVDALHFFRTGGTLEKLQTTDPKRIGYAQICDGRHLDQTDDYLAEAMNRSIPGEGLFPLRNCVALLGDHVDIDIEVPCFDMSPDFDPAQWAMKAIVASRELFEPVENFDDR